MAVKKASSVKKKDTIASTSTSSSGSAVLNNIVAEINKKYGDGAVRVGLPKNELERVPTGLISLDIDLGGGVPIGRVMNIAGGFSAAKSTLALHILKAFQKAGYPCAFFDVEGTSGTEEYLNAIGVDTDTLLYASPSSLEETCNMILDLQRAEVIKFGIWDCLIATKPNKIIEKNVGDSVQMGVMQTQLDEFFAKFALNNNKLTREGKTPFTLLTVNQLREKPTMYGNPEYCLHYDTKVVFTDGRSIPIGEVVENKIEGNVWSFNETTKQFEEKPILDWKYNGEVPYKEDYIHIESNGFKGKKFSMTVTYNHQLLTNNGWKEAQDLTLSDKLLTKCSSDVSETDFTESKITLIRPASARQLKKMGKYDISVGDNHNFLAGGTGNGVVVHNTPGGRAKDYAFSIDLRLRRAEWITEGKGSNKSIVGQVVSYKTEKNKTYKRMQEGQLDLYIEDNELGIPKFNFDNFKSLITEAVAFGIVEQGGAWYMLDTSRGLKFQGFDKLVDYLRENPDEVKILEQKLLALVSNA